MDSFTKNFSGALAGESPLLGRYDFPFSCDSVQMDSMLEISIPWHWHDSFEFLLIEDGYVLCSTSHEKWLCGPGDALFLNSKTLHSLCCDPTARRARFQMLSFDRRILSGSLTSVYEKKYITPVANLKSLEGLYFPASDPAGEPIRKTLSRTIEDASREAFGFEFEIRNHLSDIWMELLRTLENTQGKRPLFSSPDDEKIKAMILFIRENFYRNISVREIAAAGIVSERECFRCFKRALGVSPITYLVDHRIRVAARMLGETDESIVKISSACGFSTSSYFDKTFKSVLGCTPRQYRLRSRANPQ